MIKPEGGKFCLYTKDGTRKLGCFVTEEKAQDHERKILAMAAMRQSANGIMTTDILRNAGIEWPLATPTDISVLIDDEHFQFAAAYGDFEQLLNITLRQDSYEIFNVRGKDGKEFDVCIIEEGMAQASEGNPPILWTAEALADPNLHRMLEQMPVRIYQSGGGIFNHAPLETVNQHGAKLTANNAALLSNVRYGEFKRPDGKISSGVIGVLHITMSDVASFLKKGWELGKRMLGLSIDASIAKDWLRNAVKRVNEIKETTLVSNPAAGGYLLELRASAKINEEPQMELKEWLKTNNGELLSRIESAAGDERDNLLLEGKALMDAATPARANDEEPAKVDAGKTVEAAKAAAQKQAEATDPMPSILETEKTVESALQLAMGMPADFKAMVRMQFKGRPAKPHEIMDAIARTQQLAARHVKPDMPLTARMADNTITVGTTEQDRYNDAMMGLFLGHDHNKVPRFQSLRQSYYEITQPRKYHDNAQLGRVMFNEVPYSLSPLGVEQGEWYTQLRQMRESRAYAVEHNVDVRQSLLQTSSWTIAFGNTLNRFLLQVYMSPNLQEYKKIISRIDNVQDFKSQIFTRIGGYSNLPTVSEGATYTEATHAGEESVNYAVVKRGELAFFTWESFVNDDIGAIKQVPQKVMQAAAQTKYEFYFDLLRSPGTWAPDSVAIFHASHGNLSSTAFSSNALEAIILAMRDQTELTSGKPIHFEPKIVVYPSELDRAFFDSSQQVISNFGVGGTYNRNETLANWLQEKFQFTGVRANYWTDATDYCVLANPLQHDTIIAGFLGGREEPEMWFADRPDSYHMFNADKIALKVRDIYGGTYGDYRSLHKAVVAG